MNETDALIMGMDQARLANMLRQEREQNRALQAHNDELRQRLAIALGEVEVSRRHADELQRLSDRHARLSDRLSQRLYEAVNEDNLLARLTEEQIVEMRGRELRRQGLTLDTAPRADLAVLRDINGWVVATGALGYRMFVQAPEAMLAARARLNAVFTRLKAEQQTEADYDELLDIQELLDHHAHHLHNPRIDGKHWRFQIGGLRGYVNDSLGTGRLIYAGPDRALILPGTPPAGKTNFLDEALGADYGRMQRYQLERGRQPAADPLAAP